MTHRQPTTRSGWWRLLLAAVAAALVTLLGAGTASAATVPDLETRVGASTPVAAYVVGPHECITAGQRWGNAPPQGDVTAGSCVAAKSSTSLLDDAVRIESHLARLANTKGASYFDIGGEWDALVAQGQDPWALNQHFLDGRIAAGDRVLLSVPKGDIVPGTYLAREVELGPDGLLAPQSAPTPTGASTFADPTEPMAPETFIRFLDLPWDYGARSDAA